MREVVDRFTGIAASYDTVIPFFSTFAAELVRVGAPEGPTLDMACGTGAVLSLLPAGSVGIDLTEAMLRRTAAPVCAADVATLPVRSASFDLVTCGFGVFFFPAITAALAEVARVGRRFAATTFGPGYGGFGWQRDFMRDQGFAGTAASRSTVGTADGLQAALDGWRDVRIERVTASFTFDVDTYERWFRSTSAPDVLGRFARDNAFVADWRACAAANDLVLHQDVDVIVATAP